MSRLVSAVDFMPFPKSFQFERPPPHHHNHKRKKTDYLFLRYSVCLLKNIFKKKINFGKVNYIKINYFLMFGSVIENKLENTFQYLVISWKMSWKITY
jgi:hypothetical protein